MATPVRESAPLTRDELAKVDDLVAETELGGRRPGGGVATFLWSLALGWSIFQLYVASPLPFILGGAFVLDEVQARLIFYAIAVFLTYCSYPAFKSSPRTRIPLADWAMGIVSACGSLYIFVLYEELGQRSGAPITRDVVVAIVGMLGLFEATRRAVGVPLLIVIVLFIAYGFGGSYLPDAISHKGASLTRMADHMWLTTQGVFGITLGITASLIFVFVLFGTLLDKAGAGNWFIKVSFALLGHLRGGPAKAAVVSSGLTGLISGSSLANVVTTGTFTIPLMKRAGFPAAKAAAVEASSSINGQIMPPVMGAAAFIMTEFVGISYVEVAKHAFLPATISYIGLYYIVHLESVKMGLKALPRRGSSPLAHRLALFVASAAGIVVLTLAVYDGILAIRSALGPLAPWAIWTLFVLVYLGLLWVSSRVPELAMDPAATPLDTLPELKPTLLAGLHYVLPVAVLVWGLIVERFSPAFSVHWAIVAIVFIMLTQRPILAFFRGTGDYGPAFRRGVADMIDGMVAGARGMVGVGIALAAAGVVVGIVSLSSLGVLMASVVEALSGGSVLVMLLLTAMISIVLGMGLPTAANYVVVASLMAPVIVTLGAQGGLIVPLVAVHLFVFYCGLIAGTTPPVAVDAFAAAALARADPLKTCLYSFYFSMRTMILPFIFVFNTELLLIGVERWWHFLLTATVSVVAMLAFIAATQHHFLVRNRVHESALLLLVAFTLVRPGFWIDRLYPPFESVDPGEIEALATRQPNDALLRMWVEGENFSRRLVRKTVVLPLGAEGPSGAARLEKAAGVKLRLGEGKVLVERVSIGSAAEQSGMDAGWRILTLEVPTHRPDKEWFYIPALLLLGAIMLLQLSRRRGAAEPVAQAGSGA